MYGPIGCWRRMGTPSCERRTALQRRRSASVASRRSWRARRMSVACMGLHRPRCRARCVASWSRFEPPPPRGPQPRVLPRCAGEGNHDSNARDRALLVALRTRPLLGGPNPVSSPAARERGTTTRALVIARCRSHAIDHALVATARARWSRVSAERRPAPWFPLSAKRGGPGQGTPGRGRAAQQVALISRSC